MSSREELEQRLARIMDETARRSMAPDEPSPVERALEAPEADDSWFEDFGEGLASSLMKTGYGVADLVGGVGEGSFQLDPKRLEDWQTEAKDSWGGTAGNVVGEVGQLLLMAAGTAIPNPASPAAAAGAVASVGRIASLLKGAKTAGRGARKVLNIVTPKAPVLREATAAAALGGLQMPGEHDSRLGNAAANAAMVGVGGAALKGLSRAVKGAAKTDAAKKLMAAGAKLTPGQAVEGGTFRAIENWMGTLPVTAKATKFAKERGIKDWGKYVAGRLGDKLGVELDGFTNASMKSLDDAVEAGYIDAWGKAPGVSSRTLSQLRKNITDRIDDGVDITAEGKLKIILKNAEQLLKSPSATSKQQLDKLIKNGKTATDDHAINDTLDILHDVIRANLNKPAREALEEMDAIFPEYRAFEKAMNSAASVAEEVVTPTILREAAVNVGRFGKKAARGEAPLQDAARMGTATVERGEPTILMDIFKGAAQNIPTWQKGFDVGGDVVLGQTRIQQLARPAVTKLDEMLRQLRAERGVGAGSFFAGMEQ